MNPDEPVDVSEGSPTPLIKPFEAIVPPPDTTVYEGVAITYPKEVTFMEALKELMQSNALKTVAVGICTVSGGLMTVFPPHTIAFRVCAGLVSVCAAFGIGSTGIEKSSDK